LEPSMTDHAISMLRRCEIFGDVATTW
jgi:hypothetical protein